MANTAANNPKRKLMHSKYTLFCCFQPLPPNFTVGACSIQHMPQHSDNADYKVKPFLAAFSACMSLGQEILSNTYHAQLLEPWLQHNPHILSPGLNNSLKCA